ncbi:MAG: YjbQ family protein [Gemmatimonadetes bacterium]|nr:YjbQ family protein [Gemmatimonadota bacterium]
MTVRLHVRTTARSQLVDITAQVRAAVREAALRDGVVHLWSLHTTCALTVNEGADPDVAADLAGFMGRLIPQQAGFHHSEGNSDSHLKTSLFGPGLTLLIEGGELVLGTWQHVFLAEWDGPRAREVALRFGP